MQSVISHPVITFLSHIKCPFFLECPVMLVIDISFLTHYFHPSIPLTSIFVNMHLTHAHYTAHHLPISHQPHGFIILLLLPHLLLYYHLSPIPPTPWPTLVSFIFPTNWYSPLTMPPLQFNIY